MFIKSIPNDAVKKIRREIAENQVKKYAKSDSEETGFCLLTSLDLAYRSALHLNIFII